MQTITQALTTVIWYGATLPLANAPWKSSTLIVRQVNGSGYSSFDPTQQFNSLAQIATGQVLIVESLASAYGGAGYQLDNGTAPTAPANPVRLIASFPAGGTSPAPITLLPSGDQAGTYNLDPNNAPVGVSTGAVSYTINGTAASLPFLLAAGNVLIITATTVAGTPGSVTLLKQ